jgi:hypothetical protein
MSARPSGPALGIGAAALAVICCAGLPAIGALVGSITLAALLGVAGGVVVLAAVLVGAVVLVRSRRRRGSCALPPGGEVR